MPVLKKIEELSYTFHQASLYVTMTLINQKLYNFRDLPIKCHQLLSLIKFYEQYLGVKLKAKHEEQGNNCGNL